jgi:pseudoazurin|tara:strand:+ start:967 stop:1419 length:453 start_codon:yes stop_codon:yes gene_type:complete
MEFFMRQFFVIFTILSIQFDLYGANHSVKMLNQGSSGVMVFEPAYLKINIGDSVTFESTDAAHNSASIPGMIPSSASSWNGGLSQDITVMFDVAGIYGYQCTPHSMMAMVGVIQVGDDKSNLDSAKAVAQQFKSSFVMNQTRLDDLLSKI